MRPTHEASDPRLRPHVANLWLAGFNRSHPNLADDCFLACQGSTASWERLFVFGVVRTDAWRKPVADWFGSGYEGQDAHDQVVNGALAFANVRDLEDLKGTDEATLLRFDATWFRWKRFRDNYLENMDGKPLPEPPKPEPVKPAPVPVPPPPANVEPKPAPAPAPAPAPEKPAEPKKPFRFPAWAKVALTFSAGFIAGAIDKILDGWLGAGEYDKVIRQILNALAGMF